MTVHYLGDPKFRKFDSNGAPLAGGKLYTYEPGVTAIPKTAYTDAGAGTPHANPIVLDGDGEAEVWLDGLYYLVLHDADGNERWTMDQVHGVGFQPTTAAADEWLEQNDTPTYIGATQFSVPGDLRVSYHVGRRVRATISAGVVYGTITVSAFTTVTTLTVAWDGAGALDVGLSAVALGILTTTQDSIPGVELSEDDWTFQGNVTIEGTLGVTGGVIFASTLDVTGRVTAPGIVPPGGHVYSVLPSMDGYLLSYGQTMGSAASGADEADDDYELAFTNLWDNLSDAVAPVSGGRGASAAADWAANKTITLLDGRGKGLIALDNMGGVSANVVTDSEADTMGDSSGAEDSTIGTTHLPAHDHGSAGAHIHGVIFGNGGSGNAFWDPQSTGSYDASPGYATTNNGENVLTTAGNHAHNSVGSGTALPVMNPYIAMNLFVRV